MYLHWFCLLAVVDSKIQSRRFYRQGIEPEYIPWSPPVPPTYIPWEPRPTVPPTYVPWNPATRVPPTYVPWEAPTKVPPTYVPWEVRTTEGPTTSSSTTTTTTTTEATTTTTVELTTTSESTTTTEPTTSESTTTTTEESSTSEESTAPETVTSELATTDSVPSNSRTTTTAPPCPCLTSTTPAPESPGNPHWEYPSKRPHWIPFWLFLNFPLPCQPPESQAHLTTKPTHSTTSIPVEYNFHPSKMKGFVADSSRRAPDPSGKARRWRPMRPIFKKY